MTEGIITTKGAAFASHTHKKIQFALVHSIRLHVNLERSVFSDIFPPSEAFLRNATSHR